MTLQLVYLIAIILIAVTLFYNRPTKHVISKEDARICLFTRDSQQKYKDLLKEKEVKRVEKVCIIYAISMYRCNIVLQY
jgi:hypothetical protein